MQSRLYRTRLNSFIYNIKNFRKQYSRINCSRSSAFSYSDIIYWHSSIPRCSWKFVVRGDPENNNSRDEKKLLVVTGSPSVMLWRRDDSLLLGLLVNVDRVTEVDNAVPGPETQVDAHHRRVFGEWCELRVGYRPVPIYRSWNSIIFFFLFC